MKISSTQLGTSTTLAGRQTVFTPTSLVDPMSVLLFGKRRARRLDPRKFPKLKKALRKLEAMKDEISEILGVADGTFQIELCEGNNASVSRDGTIGVGKNLIEEHEDDNDFWVAVVGHEIGHQPWTWPEALPPGMTLKSRDAVYREEEAKADRFAGRVLAELGADPSSVAHFLLRNARFETKPPSDYYPAEVRVQMILDAHHRRDRALRRGQAVLGDAGARRLRDLR